MGFSFFHALGGAAERLTEMRDEERQNARDIAKQTLDYQLRNADSLREERANKLAEKSVTAKKLEQFGYEKDQILTLARNGGMEKALEYHEYIREKGLEKVDAGVVVTKSAEIPKNSSFDEEFKKAVIGVPSQMEQGKLDAEEAKRERGFWERVFVPDTSGETSRMRATAAKGAGYASPEELAMESRRYTKDPNGDMGSVNMDAFAGIEAKDVDYWTKAKSAAGLFSAGVLKDTLNVDASYDAIGGTFYDFGERNAATSAFTRAHETALSAISSLLKDDMSLDTASASKALSDDYRKTVAKSPELEGLTGDARKNKLTELTEAWSDKWDARIGGRTAGIAGASVVTPDQDAANNVVTKPIVVKPAIVGDDATTTPARITVPTVQKNDAPGLVKALKLVGDEDIRKEITTAFRDGDMETVNTLLSIHAGNTASAEQQTDSALTEEEMTAEPMQYEIKDGAGGTTILTVKANDGTTLRIEGKMSNNDLMQWDSVFGAEGIQTKMLASEDIAKMAKQLGYKVTVEG